uniref:Uncharacterized protein n=1 Tax=Anguilla anguilla TaxID=7936 RepID=A0A0E9VZF1_ANGAN
MLLDVCGIYPLLILPLVPPHQPQGVLHDTTQNNTTPPPTSTPRHHMTQHRTTQQ